uniref:Glutathione S-transferase D7 n=1 Tax=Bemisia tabaci TaxID=7038 RepID=A0A6C0MB14_BEMTA|nr:glutathione S-transferase D7 [Bemisia tabaci]
MTVDIYHIGPSPPCRAVRLAAKLIGIDVNLKVIDITKGEQMTPEFLKLNPQHTVPVMDDNGFILTESRAIMTYLASKYGKDDSLYPKDLQKKAIVDQRLFFDLESLFQPFKNYFWPLVFKVGPHDEKKFQEIPKNLPVLEKILEASEFVAGDCITVADASIVTIISNYDMVGVDFSKYPNISRWYDQCKKVIPDYDEINQKEAEEFKKFWEHLRSL